MVETPINAVVPEAVRKYLGTYCRIKFNEQLREQSGVYCSSRFNEELSNIQINYPLYTVSLIFVLGANLVSKISRHFHKAYGIHKCFLQSVQNTRWLFPIRYTET
jgi:hypothetical protein